jgi:hypothetical protein
MARIAKQPVIKRGPLGVSFAARLSFDGIWHQFTPEKDTLSDI